MSIRAGSDPPTPRRSRLAPDERRAQLLAAAREVLDRDGLPRLTASAVAERAGVARGLVHHYFGPRRRLATAVLADLAAEMPAVVRTDLGDAPIEEIEARNTAAFLDAFERDREVWRALLRAEAGGSPEADAIVRSVRDAIVERMAANQARGAEPTEELRLALRVFIGAAVTAASEFAFAGRATREQTEVLLAGTLRAMMRDVVPRIPPVHP